MNGSHPGHGLYPEDDSPSRYLKSRILERAGFQVLEAVTCADAIRRASDERLRLVLLDLRLPSGGGFAVCQQIKANRPSLPVVMITSTYATAQERQDGLASGADAYLIEPVPADRLVHIVRQFLQPASATSLQHDAWLVTDDRAIVMEISGPGHRLLNLSARGALGRNLTTFFAGDRHLVFGDMAHALDGQVVEREIQLRPRDRRPLTVRYELARDPSNRTSLSRLHWTFEPLASTSL